jgi:hypothetical protein
MSDSAIYRQLIIEKTTLLHGRGIYLVAAADQEYSADRRLRECLAFAVDPNSTKLS